MDGISVAKLATILIGEIPSSRTRSVNKKASAKTVTSEIINKKS